MQIYAYLTFEGDCEEAMRHYAKVLGGKIVAMRPHEGTPAADYVPPDWRAKILHARLHVGDAVLMASDSPPECRRRCRASPSRWFLRTLTRPSASSMPSPKAAR